LRLSLLVSPPHSTIPHRQALYPMLARTGKSSSLKIFIGSILY
jgi:hypothetical protein